MSKDESKNLPALPGENFLAVKNADSIQEIVAENLAGIDLRSYDLPQISIPSGGATLFTIETASGPVSLAEIECVILHHHRGRRYFEKSFEETGGSEPPDCLSNDGITGTKNAQSVAQDLGQGGACSDCPLSKFESSPKGDGTQACGERRELYLLRPDAMLPDHLSLPPGSLTNWKDFTVRMTNAGQGILGAVVKIGLVQDKNKKGTKYARATFTLAGKLEGPTLEAIKKYRSEMMKGM